MNRSADNLNESSDVWNEVHLGFLSSAAAKNRNKKQRRKALVAGIPLGILCLLVIGGFSLLGPDREVPYKGGMACSDFSTAYQEYLAGDASAGTKARIAKHIEDCILCQGKYDQIANTQSESEYSVSPTLLAAIGAGTE